MTAAEEDRDKANDKEERLLEECEKLNQAVDDLEDQLKAVSSVLSNIHLQRNLLSW